MKNIFNNICIILLASLLISSIFSNTSVSVSIKTNDISNKILKNEENLTDKELIDEYTWSVMQYCDWLKNTVNSETVYTPSPTNNPLLILTDFMQPELCKIALEVYCENEDGSLN